MTEIDLKTECIEGKQLSSNNPVIPEESEVEILSEQISMSNLLFKKLNPENLSQARKNQKEPLR